MLGFRCAKIEINEHMEPRKKKKDNMKKNDLLLYVVYFLFSKLTTFAKWNYLQNY